VTASLAPL